MLTEKIKSQAIVDAWLADGSRKARLWQLLIPAIKQVGLKLSFLKGAKNSYVKLQPHSFNVDTNPLKITGFDKMELDLPYFKNSKRIDEKVRQDFLTFSKTNDANLIAKYERQIVSQFYELLNGAEVIPDALIGQLLSSGVVSISENGVAFSHDYGVAASQKETLVGGALWTDTVNSNPMYDLERWMDAVQDLCGERPTRAICTRKTFNYLKQNAKINTELNAVRLNVYDRTLKEFIMSKLDLEFMIYNETAVNYDGSTSLIYPDNKITLLPAGNIGNMYFGTTPAEIDLMERPDKDVVLTGDEDGIAVNTIVIDDPVNIETIVSEICMPSGENLNKIFIGTVG